MAHGKIHNDPDGEDRKKEVPEEIDANGNKSGLSRRQFLGAVTAIGGTALIGSYSSASAKEFGGWPDSYGCLTDLTRCVGCRSCEEACNKANNLPKPAVPFDDKAVFDDKRRPTQHAYTVVNRYDNPKDKDKPVYRKIQCNHCKEPACATACPIHAYNKTPEGAVLYNPELCFGCRYCMVACPFYVPAYDYDSALKPKIVKCILCYDRIKKGGMPACAEACPAGTITFGKREELIKIARERIAKNPDKYIDHIYGENEVGGTNWLYISGVPFEQVGFPTNLPATPLVEQTKGFLSAVPLVFTVWPALFGMCYAAVRHRDKIGEEKSHSEKREEEK
jgi:formate dehydrogenase iron-sulfur subunit